MSVLDLTNTSYPVLRTAQHYGVSYEYALNIAETAAVGGVAHLVNFLGTDNVPALVYAEEFYAEEMAGFSIPATEHSTITTWGKQREKLAYENVLDTFVKPGKIAACVSDSYDLWNAITEIWGKDLKDKVSTSGGVLVIRPDSGEPVFVSSHTCKLLYEIFGGAPNTLGYKVLADFIREIQGDGVNPFSIVQILDTFEDMGFSTENIAFGMGGALLQNLNRDTLGYAMKANAAFIDNEWIDVNKNPKTDPAKASRAGRVAVIERDGELVPVTLAEFEHLQWTNENKLRTVWLNGNLIIDQTLAEIRCKSDEVVIEYGPKPRGKEWSDYGTNNRGPFG